MKNNLLKYWKLGVLLIVAFILVHIVVSGSQHKDNLRVIRAAKVTRGDLNVSVTSTGSVKPYNRVEIKSPIPGRVEAVLVEEGQVVHQGQIVAWLSSIQRAAVVDAARSEGPEAFKHWQDAYQRAPILAPLDGTIIVQSVQAGQTVQTTDDVVVLSDRLIVEALVDETDLAQIQLEQKTEIRLDTYPKEVFLGKVFHIKYESTLVNNVNVYPIDIVLDKIPPTFRSGMTANVTFVVKNKTGVLLVPNEAVTVWPKKLPKPAGTEFAVYQRGFGGKLIPLPVQIGDSDAWMTEITQGLEEGMDIQIVQKKQQAQSSSPFGGTGMGGPPKR